MSVADGAALAPVPDTDGIPPPAPENPPTKPVGSDASENVAEGEVPAVLASELVPALELGLDISLELGAAVGVLVLDDIVEVELAAVVPDGVWDI